jgi:hypothetical protein
MFSPRDAFSAISSADNRVLDVLGIALFFLLGRFPGCYQMVVFAVGVKPDLENYGTETPTAPPDRTEVLWIIVLLVNQVRLVENLLRFFQLNAMFLAGPHGSWICRI